MKRPFRALLAVIVVAGGPVLPSPARAQPALPLLIPPVDGVVERRFEPPQTPWGSGHRGIDYAVATGVAIRAAGTGRVAFAGSIAGRLAVTIDHGAGLETTYSILSQVDVTTGDVIGQGHYIGKTGYSHPGRPAGLHFGVKLNGAYVDPLAYLGPVDVRGALHLAPVIGHRQTSVVAPASRSAIERDCAAVARLGGRPPSLPNDNIAVAVAGIASRTGRGRRPDVYSAAYGPRALGYRGAKTYSFSYRGPSGRDLHEPYDRTDTYGDIRHAGQELRELLIAIAKRHPGVDVDLITHSQGGIVARVFLEKMAESWDPRLPRVEHLITLATPHTGAPLAGAGAGLTEHTVTGRWLMDGLSWWARLQGPLPDPNSTASRQLAPRSDLLESLAVEDVTYGTRVLALATPSDFLVPADRAVYPGKPSRVVPVRGLFSHGGIVRSSKTRALAYAFLRDAAVACRTVWDSAGRVLGGAIGLVEDRLDDVYRYAERGAAGPPIGAVPWIVRGLRSVASATVNAVEAVAGGFGDLGRRLAGGAGF